MALAKAQQQVDAISSKKSELVSRREALNRRIGSGQEETARRYLTGDTTGLEDTARLQAELDAISIGLDLLGVDLQEAELNLLGAKARDFRDQAEQKKAELEQLSAKTTKVLAELSSLEDVRFTASILSSQPVEGSWHGGELSRHRRNGWASPKCSLRFLAAIGRSKFR